MKFTPVVLISILILPILLYFHFLGVITHDEGYILNSAQRIIEGSVVYRDFHFNYTPLSIFATGVAFMAFGESVLASRILMLTLSFTSSILVFLIVKNVTKKTIYAFLSTLIFISWGPANINFAWPIMFVIPLSLIIIYLILLFDKYKIGLIPFLVGIVSFFVLLSNQIFGIVLVSAFVYFLSIKKNWVKNITNTIFGFLWGLIFFIIYLLSTNSFGPFLHDFNTFAISNAFLNSGITTPILSTSSPIQDISRIFFYLILPVSSLTLILLLIYRKKYKLVFIPLLTFTYYIVGTLSVRNYVHLLPILSLSGLPITIFINKLPTFPIKTFGYSILIFLILAGFQTALQRNYYNWDKPLIHNASHFGERLFTTERLTNDYQLIEIVNKYTKPNDYIYVDTYAPDIYFVFNRKNPTPYDFPEFSSKSEYEKVTVYSLIAKDVKLVFLTSKEVRTKIEEYVIENYQFLGKTGEYYAYLKP